MTGKRIHIIPMIGLLTAGLFLLSACKQTSIQVKDDNYYRAISNRIQANSISNPESNFAYIDSLEEDHAITPEIADYFRSNAHYPLGHPRAVEYYNKKAINSDALYKEWRRAYYICSRNLANNLDWKGDYEGALTYATKAYNRAINDTSFVAQLNAPGLLMFIALSQDKLGKKEESMKNLEESYRLGYELARKDTSFNTRYYLVQNTIGALGRMDSLVSKEQCYTWGQRGDEAVRLLNESAKLNPIGEVDQLLLDLGKAQKDILTASMLVQHGEIHQADKAYKRFLNSSYFKNNKPIIYQYNYLCHAKQWKQAAALIPQVDSIRKSNGLRYSMDYLIKLKQQRQTLLNAGLTKEAQRKGEQLFESVDSAIKYQQLSAADELATIFETTQKERTITEQHAKIVRQWGYTAAICITIIIIFLIYYLLYRRKVAQKMQKEHNKLQKAYNQLTLVNEKAEESSRMKSAFIQQISHEIRTPLNILSGFAQILTADDIKIDDATRKEATKEIQVNTKRLTELVNKMLELSESSLQTNKAEYKDLIVSHFAQKAIQTSMILQAPDINFTVDTVEEISNSILRTQERQAVRALSFILGNARKFTKKGDVRMVIKKSDDGKFFEFIVEDTGIGIPAKEAEHIFEEFVQLDDYTEGTGIGLTVARAFARQLGGDVIFDPSYTGGARFIMKLPTT